MTRRTADVAVIGAGVIGASIAWHLSKLGAKVTVFDRGTGRGAGSTGRATGGFRAQYETEINVRLSLLSREKLRRFADEVGADPGYRPTGYLWLAADDGQVAALAKAQALQHALGLREARMVTPAEIAALQPHANLDGVAGGAFCQTDGFLRPMAILNGYLDAAIRLGAAVRHAAPIDAIDVANAGRGAADPRDPGAARITSLRAGGERWSVGAVVNAAGAWAAEVAALAGVDLPVVPLRRQVAITQLTDVLPAEFPMTIWDDGFHLRVRDGRVLLLRPAPGDPQDPWSDQVDPDWLDDIAVIAPVRVPALRGVALDRSRAWAGLYEMSPDHHALLGWAPGCPNLLLVNGSSGHGVMHAPALGLLAAEIATFGAARTLHVHALRPSRFAEGDPVPGSALL